MHKDFRGSRKLAKKNLEFRGGGAKAPRKKLLRNLFFLRALRLCGECSSSPIGCGSAALGSLR
jgi:hypothetical protein